MADDDAPSVGLLATFVADGRAWVVCAGGRVLGFVLAEELDGGCHIEQLSILPDHQGRGLARSLVDHVAAWALERGYTLLSLTTFGDVACNRPLFEHLGFEVEDTGRLGPDLKGRRAEEAARGLDPARRVVMVRNVQP